MNQDGQKDKSPNPSNHSWRQRLASPRGLLILGIMSLVVLGSAAYVAVMDKDDQTATTATVVQPTAEVTFTKDGLSPASITIASGTQVIWTNTDDAPHQTAPDPHPSHDSVEGFDPNVTLQKGEAFAFTFETAGTYTYHDHLNPLDTRWQGTIIVE